MAVRLFRDFRRPQSASVPLGPFTQGVNEKAEPHLLEFSELSDGQNAVLDETTGRTKKRPGTLFKVEVPFLVDPPKRSYNFIKRDGTEILLITDDKILVSTQDLTNFVNITPAAFLTGGEFVGGAFTMEFETIDDRVVVTNGVDPVFSWDGSAAMVAYDRGSDEITLSVGDSNTQVADALLNRNGDGTTWVGQIVVVTAAADPNIIGFTARVLTFSDATDTITFDAIAGLAVGDKIKVGVAIPRGRIIRHAYGTTFVGATPDNLSEIRFTDTVDPNEPQITISFENPHAWPSELQLEIGLGDRLWGFTPVYRDRFATFKASGLVRIDPDPTFRFVPTVISTQIGSRFPNTWRQHNNVLMFLGQDSDGLPDVYMTDFTDVTHFNRKHSRTLDNLKQPSSIFRNFSITAKSEFDAGVLSSLIETLSSAVQCKKIDTSAENLALVESASNVDMESEPGRIGLLGAPLGDNHYTAAALPESSTPAWSVGTFPFVSARSITAGVLEMRTGFGFPNTAGGTFYFRDNVLDAAQDCLLVVRSRAKTTSNGPGTLCMVLANGTRGIQLEEAFGSVVIRDAGGAISFSPAGYANAQTFKVWHMLLKSNGAYKLWLNGTLVRSGTALNTATNTVRFVHAIPTGFNSFTATTADQQAYIDYLHFNAQYKGDSLNSLSGAVSPATLPDVLPTSGNVVFSVDYKKQLENNPTSYRYGKYHFDVLDRGQTLTIETSAKNRAGASLAGFSAVATGQEPGIDNSTPKGQKLLLKMSFGIVSADHLGDSQEVTAWTGGFLYLSPVINIGTEIKAWESFQRTLLGAFPRLDIRIRRATDASLAADAVATPHATDEAGWLKDIIGVSGNVTDADGFVNIADAQNVGSAFGGAEGPPDPPFPDARYVQVLLSGHVDALADTETKGVDSLLVNWIEGSPEILPTMAVLLKKKWLLIAAELDSTFNNIIVTIDGNRSFMNWLGMDANWLVWFRGKLYAASALRKEFLQLEDGLLRDDDGPDGGGGRNVKAIDAFLVTKQEIGGEIHERKKAQALEVMADNDVTTAITISQQRDEASVFTPMGPVLTFSPTSTHARIRCPVGLQFKRIAFKAQNAELDQDLPLEGFVFTYDRVPGRSGL